MASIHITPSQYLQACTPDEIMELKRHLLESGKAPVFANVANRDDLIKVVWQSILTAINNGTLCQGSHYKLHDAEMTAKHNIRVSEAEKGSLYLFLHVKSAAQLIPHSAGSSVDNVALAQLLQKSPQYMGLSKTNRLGKLVTNCQVFNYRLLLAEFAQL